MPIDAYSPCPGGVDKKVKFCCSDLTTELDKLSRMIEGDQRIAALEYIDKLEGKFQDRACLLAIKSALLASGEREQELQATVERFVKAHPQNPVALAEAALFTAAHRGIQPGIAQLQDAMERVGTNIPRQVYDALGGIAVAALQGGRPIVALAHLMLQSMLDRQDEAPVGLIGRIMNSPSVPLLMKDVRGFDEAPEGEPWKQPYDEALREARMGRWRRAAAWLLVIASKHGNPPRIWQTIGTLRAWLADHAGAVEALRRAAADLPFDEAVEVEALAQLLDPADTQNMIELVSAPYEVRDFERLTELFLAADRAAPIPVDPRQFADEEVPPRAAYVLLDRAKPAAGAELTLDSIPRVLATVFLFGKQTDREAHIDMMGYRTDEFAQAEELLKNIAGETLGAAAEAEVIDREHPVRHAMSPNWHLPEDAPPDRVRALSEEFRQQNLFERWPRLPLAVLDNKTALEAKDDEKYRVRLAALVLLVELSGLQEGSDLDFERFRQLLNVPRPSVIEPDQTDPLDLPLPSYPRLDVSKLSDEQLPAVFRSVAGVGMRGLLRKVSEEILQRESLQDKIDLSSVYRALIVSSTDPEEMLRRIGEARDWATRTKRSSAPWDIEELNLQLMRGQADAASQLIDHLMREHINEPGVKQALGELLYAAGVIGADGRPVPSPAGGPAAMPPPPAAEPGGIWTPDGGSAAEPKSKLWVPGMD